MEPTVPSRHLQDEVREVDVTAAANGTWKQLQEATTPYSARTLVKQQGIRVVLITMKKGARIPQHRAEGDITVHVLTGKISFCVGAEERLLGPGKLLAVARELRHDLQAVEDSEVLLTLGG